MKSHSVRVFSVAVACAIAISVTYAKAASIDVKLAPQATLDALQQNFGMAEVISLLSASASRSSSKAYFQARAPRFNFMATQRQGPMVIDGYSVLDMKSPIVGYSLFFYGDNGPLVIADAAVNATRKDAISAAVKLTATSLDSVSNPDGSKMYFLGIHNLDSSRFLKIMVRAGVETPMGPDYAIRYVVSKR